VITKADVASLADLSCNSTSRFGTERRLGVQVVLDRIEMGEAQRLHHFDDGERPKWKNEGERQLSRDANFHIEKRPPAAVPHGSMTGPFCCSAERTRIVNFPSFAGPARDRYIRKTPNSGRSARR